MGKNPYYINKKSGVSMISLVIAIIILIILATVIIYTSGNSIDTASKSTFIQELSDVETRVAEKRISNQITGSDEETVNKSFLKAYIENPPENFLSFDDDAYTGYVVDISSLSFEGSKRGLEYTKYTALSKDNMVVFGESDVYIYDATGKVFYAKGFIAEEGTYYTSADISKDGPQIVSTSTKLSSNKKSVELTIGIKKLKDGELSVFVEENKAEFSSEKDGINYYKITLYENRAYEIIASEENAGRTTKFIEITEINAEVYTITFDANGGINAPAAQKKTENVVMRITKDVPTNDGLYFMGWSESSSASFASYLAGGEFALNKDTTLYAVWKTSDRTYDLIYSANGGTGAPEAVKGINSTKISNITPTREGYEFEGWSENAKTMSGDYKAGDEIVLSKNTVLYASWKKSTDSLTVSIFMKVDGDDTAVDPGTVTGAGITVRGRKVTISATAKSGFVFKKWVVAEGNVELSDTQSSAATFVMPQEDVSINAIFERTEVTLRYDANKGSKAPNRSTYKYGAEATISSQEPIRTGYTFQGWSLESTTGANVKYISGDKFDIYTDTTLYAVWKMKIATYSIKYDLQGGQNSGEEQFSNQEKIKGIPVNIYNYEPIRSGFTFKGWSLASSSSSIIYNPGDEYTKDADVTLFAVWKDEINPVISITVTQSGDDTILHARGEDDGLIAAYAWSTSESVPTVWTSISQTRVFETEKVLSSKGDVYIWMKDAAGNCSSKQSKVYEISYDKNGGTGGVSKQYKVEGVNLNVSNNNPKKYDYVFIGWTLNGILGSKTYETIENEGDLTLKATWGAAYFNLSDTVANLEIDGEPKKITVTKNDYTGNITVKSSNEKRATASIEGSIITITPGTEIGEVNIIVSEDSAVNSSKTIYAVVEKGTRKITLDEISKEFTYGDAAASIGYKYTGTTVIPNITTTNSGAAIASINLNNVTITPKGFGEAVITLSFVEDELYLSQTATINVKVNQRAITVTPKAGQSKVYDGTPSTPTLEYTHTGEAFGEVAGFTGNLVREIGSEVGQYLISLGTNNLQLADNGTFKKKNYYLKISGNVYFSILACEVEIPKAIEGQVYDGTTKYGIPDGGMIYTRKGDFAKIDAGTYIAVAELKDSKNYIWKDGGKTAANIEWSIAKKTMNSSNVTISKIADATYTGNYITPEPTVIDTSKNKVLTKLTDYTLTYKNNVNVGVATVTVNGKGNYEGTLNATFNIKKANMNVSVTNYSGTYDNKYHSIKVSVTWPTSDAKIYYSTNILNSSNYKTAGSTENPKFIDAVTNQVIYYYITADNFNDYTGSGTITISRKDITSNVTLSNIKNYAYTGSNITQNPTLVDNDLGRTLINETDYTLSYSNNLYPGTATMTITATGNYTGTKAASFTIYGDTITLNKSTENFVTSLTVSISKSLTLTTLQYSYDNTSWTNYTGALTITKDCTVYARSVHNSHVIGTNSIVVNNICEHNWVSPTCTTDGYCKLCNTIGNTKLGHDYTTKDTSSTYLYSSATCTKAAVYYYRCSRCSSKGTSTYSYGSALGHNYTSKTTTSTYLKSEARCSYPATYYYKCTRCSSSSKELITSVTGEVTREYFYTYGSALGHDYGSWYANPAATCTTSGTNRRDCRRSGCYVYETSTLNALGHNYGSWITSSSATCTSAGSQYRTCSRCSNKETQSIAALGHNYSGQSATSTYLRTSATCTTAATYYYKCTRCSSAWNSASAGYYTYGSALGHTTSGGHSWDLSYHWQICTRCTKEINLASHSFGSASYYNSSYHSYSCSCGYIKTVAHSWSAATCTTAKKCSTCGTTSGSVPGHNYSWTITKAATCSSTGTKKGTCTRCSATTTSTIPKDSSNHNGANVYSRGSSPTCTTSGTIKTYCSACDALLSTTTKAALGHSWGSYSVTKSATCTTAGSKKRSCQRSGCSSTETVTIAATGHSYGSYTKYSGTQHRRQCSKCSGYSYASHTYGGGDRCTVCGYSSALGF